MVRPTTVFRPRDSPKATDRNRWRERDMRDRVRIVAIAVSIVVATSTAALAGNLCITQGANIVLAGRKFTLPGKDKCKAIAGFNLSDLCSGVACTPQTGRS